MNKIPTMTKLLIAVDVKDGLPKDDYPMPIICKDERGVEYYDVAIYDGEFEHTNEEHEVTHWYSPLSETSIGVGLEDAIVLARDIRANAYKNLSGTDSEYWKGEICAAEAIMAKLIEARKPHFNETNTTINKRN